MSGSQAPVASQKGAMVPLASITGDELTPNSVAEVPRDTTSCPGLQWHASDISVGDWGYK